MANLTKNEKYIVDMYVRYFGKAPSKAEIAKYNDFKTPKLILNEIRGDADETKPLNTKEFVNNAFQNLFGRDATTKEMNKYSKVVDAGKNLPINAIVKSAKKADKGVYEAKKAIAIMLAEQKHADNYNLDKITKDTYADVYNLKTKKLLVDTVAQLETKIDKMPDNVTGQTFTLTASSDTFVGAEKGDVFNAYDVVSGGSKFAALNSIDSLDGGEGKDTLNVKSDSAITAVSATIKNIETINLESGAAIGASGADFDTTTFTGVETLNATKGTSAYLKAAATTDVNVSGVTTGAVAVDGGKNVDIKAAGNAVTSKGAAGTVKVTDAGKAGTATSITVENGTDVTVNATTNTAAGTIDVGDTVGKTAAKAATGNVEVNSTFTAVAGASVAANAISVDGGKTITVNQMVTSSDTVLASIAGQTITQGAVVIGGQDTTTTVTVKQEKSTAVNPAVVAVPEKLSTSTVTFKAMTTGQSVSVNGLTFKASKDLTAAEVAAAFANLEIGDTQVNSGPTANGIFTGVNGTAAIWTSGAVTNVDATTSTVTYSANVAGTPAALSVANSGAPVPVASAPTVGVLAVDAEAGVTGIINGTVTITDGGIVSIKTISVDGYANSTISANVLETLTLANSGGATAGATNATMTVTTASTGSLTLNLDNVNGNVNLDGGASGATLTGLNITTTGEDSKFALTAAKVETLTINATADLDISTSTAANFAALKTVDVNGAGSVNLGNLTASDLNTFDASGNTGGVTAEINTLTANVGTITEYVFSAGNDVVTLADKTVNTKITLGAGDDKITLATSTVIADVVATIDGGTGSNTIDMDAAVAQILSSNDTFEGKISNFSKLSLGQVAIKANNTVNLENMDDISYVISANTFGSNTNQTEYSDVTFTDLAAGQSVTVAGLTLTNTTGSTILADAVAAGFASVTAGNAGNAITNAVWTNTLTGFSSAAASGAVVTFTSTTLNENVTDITESGAGVAAATAIAKGTFTPGNSGTSTAATIALTTHDLLKGQSVTIAGVTVIAQKNLSADEVSVAFNGTPATSANNYTVVGSYNTTIAGMTAGGTVAGTSGTVTITDKSDVYTLTVDPEYTPTVSTLVAAPDAVTVDTTQGAGSASNGSLTLTNMANNGTLELIDAGAGVTVTMKDATGSTDTFNIVTKVTSVDLDFGEIVVAGVETINISSYNREDDNNDGTTSTAELASVEKATIDLKADKATTIKVTGDSAVALTLDVASVKVATVDASTLTGALTFTASNAGMTVKGGAGDDTLSVLGAKSGVVLTGGAGTDTFDVSGFDSAGNAGSAVTITDLTAGETIVFSGTGAEKFVSSKITLISEATFTEYVAEAAKVANAASAGVEDNIAWFQYNNNTFAVQDMNSDGTFNTGDIIVKINGVKDLSTASFNADLGTLEIA